MFGFIPNNIELYKLALIHKSASITLDNGQHINNERLEFLGDAIIESVSSDYLFIEFPDKNEGFLTQMRSKMVSRQSLNAVAKRIGLDDHVITNSTNNSAQKHIYGDAFEAMMGAIYLDQGYDFVNRLLINKIFAQYLKVDTLLESETDFKSRLIEWCQKNHHTIYFATSHDKTYSSSNPFFYSKVLIDNIEVGYGAGESKKEAEQRAAHSVSQGFSDEDCTKLMDRLDNIDIRQQNSQNEKSAPKQNDKSQTKRAEKSATSKREKSATDSDKKASEKPAEKSVEKPMEKDVEKVADKSAEKSVEKKTSSERAEQNSTTEEEKPKRRSRRGAKPKQEAESATKQETDPATNQEAEAATPDNETSKQESKDGDSTAKPARKRTRRAPKQSDERAESATKETEQKPANESSDAAATDAVANPASESGEEGAKQKTRTRRRRTPKDKTAQQESTSVEDTPKSDPSDGNTTNS